MSELDLITSTQFAQTSVLRLTEGDFNLATKELITLRYDDCMLVLFFAQNTESIELMKIWSLVAQQVAGPIFGACNMLTERRVAEAFTKLGSYNTSLSWASLRGYPFIMAYQNSWPVGFYNGERAVQPLIDYSLTLACRSDYFEPKNLPAGMQAEANFEMPGWKQYDQARTTSLDYKVGDPIRGYDKTKKVTEVGSRTASVEAQQVQREEAAEGAAITEPAESGAETLGTGEQLTTPQSGTSDVPIRRT